MKVAQKIVVDYDDEKVYVDGERFELWLREEGPRVEYDTEADAFVVHLPVLAMEVEVVGAPKEVSP